MAKARTDFSSNNKQLMMVDHLGETPLFQAIRAQDLKMVSALIHEKVDVNHKNNAGKTPLSISLELNPGQRKDTVIEKLLEVGAKIFLPPAVFSWLQDEITQKKQTDETNKDAPSFEKIYSQTLMMKLELLGKTKEDNERRSKSIEKVLENVKELFRKFNLQGKEDVKIQEAKFRAFISELIKTGKLKAVEQENYFSRYFNFSLMAHEPKVYDHFHQKCLHHEGYEKTGHPSDIATIYLMINCYMGRKNIKLNFQKIKSHLKQNQKYDHTLLFELNKISADRCEKRLRKISSLISSVFPNFQQEFETYFMNKATGFITCDINPQLFENYKKSILDNVDILYENYLSTDYPLYANKINNFEYKQVVFRIITRSTKEMKDNIISDIKAIQYHIGSPDAIVSALFLASERNKENIKKLNLFLDKISNILGPEENNKKLPDSLLRKIEHLFSDFEIVKSQEKKIAKEHESKRREERARTEAENRKTAERLKQERIFLEQQEKIKENFKEKIMLSIKNLDSSEKKLLHSIFTSGNQLHHKIDSDEFCRLAKKIGVFKIQDTKDGYILSFDNKPITSFHRQHAHEGLDGNVLKRVSEFFATFGISANDVWAVSDPNILSKPGLN